MIIKVYREKCGDGECSSCGGAAIYLLSIGNRKKPSCDNESCIAAVATELEKEAAAEISEAA